MTKLRDDGLTITKERKDNLENLDLDADEYLAEDINCIFDTKNCLMFIQRNFHSLSITGVCNYLVKMHKKIAKIDKTYDKDTCEELNLKFKPVPDKEILKEIAESDNYRRIELSFANASLELFKGQETLNKFLGNFGNTFSDLGGVNLGITLTAGDRQNPSLNKGNLRDLAYDIESNKSLFSYAIISGKKGGSTSRKIRLNKW